MKKLLTFFVLIICVQLTYSQIEPEWVKRYAGPQGEDAARDIAVDNSGNIYITGYVETSQQSIDFITIKYNSAGVEQWVRTYNGPANGIDLANAIAVDALGNVFVTGECFIDTIAIADYVTLKYSSNGSLLWVRRYNGLISGYDSAFDVAVDQSGNIYVTGASQADISGGNAYATVKYNTNGNELWVRRWTNPLFGGAVAIALDNLSNVYVTGRGSTLKYDSDGVLLWGAPLETVDNLSIGVDLAGNVYVTGNNLANINLQNIITIKYDQDGQQEWIYNYNGPGNGWDAANKLAVDHLGNVHVTGFSTGNGTSLDITTLKFAGSLSIYKPKLNEKWIAGEVDTIKWTGGQAGKLFQIEFSMDNGNSYELLDFGIPADSGYYVWQLNDTILTTKAKIKLTDMVNNNITTDSDSFRIKPYVLTRVDENGNYYEYRKNRDQWGFSNTQPHMWPATWYNQFNYRGNDPFTNNLQYSQTQGDSTFRYSRSHYHPDWVSWVNTFGVDACYFSSQNGIYKTAAVLKWRSKWDTWGGSCFGIAAANALVFSYKEQFQNKYPNYPDFINPISVVSDTGVKRVVNELFTHQYGNPSKANDVTGGTKTPNQTLNDIKQMLLEDEVETRTITIFGADNSGAHTILAYKVRQDQNQKNKYYVDVYDNSNPNSNNPITIDTTGNNNNGIWSTPDWAGWNGKIYLEIISNQYFNGATFSRVLNSQSPFILSESVCEVFFPSNSPIKIVDAQGNVTGFQNNIVFNEILGSFPLIYKNGNVGPPYGYSLPTDNYSVVLNEFEEDTISTFFFTGNKSFVYERYGADATQTDRLFFDGGVSVTNPDAQTKTAKLLNLLNETTQEKLAVIRSIELAQNDSVRIENPDSNKVKLISYGTAKNYDVELNYVTENGLGRFGDFNIPLSANTSHTFVPVWTSLTNSELQVLVDIGNDGTIDDTLSLVNQVTGIGDDQGSLLTPNSYNLAQNYPNPFNPTTTISWQSPVSGHQTLKVYDVLGNEVATLVNEYRNAGNYEVTFDASHLASGIYLYRLQAGSFVETKKMILMK